MSPIENDLLSEILRSFRLHGLESDHGSGNRRYAEVFAFAIAQVLAKYIPIDRFDGSVTKSQYADLDGRICALVGAFQMLGAQVDEHNKFLKASSQPEEPSHSRWQCYCGQLNEVGRACLICDRRE